MKKNMAKEAVFKVYIADVSQYAAGMYSYRITNNGEKIFSGTVIIQ